MSSSAAAIHDDAPRVLLVDDEEGVLQGIRRNLVGVVELVTVQSGAAGLIALRDQGPFDVVVSDMRMPGMNGAMFLQHVLGQFPDVARILLTGFSDLSATVASINDAHVLRYLNKPCSPDLLREALQEGVRHHRTCVDLRRLMARLARLDPATSTSGGLTSPPPMVRPPLHLAMASAPGATAPFAQRRDDQREVAGLVRQLLAHLAALEGATPVTPRADVPSLALQGGAQPSPGLSAGDLRAAQLRDWVLAIARRLDADSEFQLGTGAAGVSVVPHVDPSTGSSDDTTTSVKGGSARENEADQRPRRVSRRLGHYSLSLEPPPSGVTEDGRSGRRRTMDIDPSSLRSVGIAQLVSGMVFAADIRGEDGTLLVAKGVDVTDALRDRLLRIAEQRSVPDPISVYTRRQDPHRRT